MDAQRETITPAEVAEMASELEHLAEMGQVLGMIPTTSVIRIVDTVLHHEAVVIGAASEWVRSTEAAEMLGVSRNTVKKWARTGRLRGAWQERDGWWQIPRASVERVRMAEQIMDAVPDVDGPLPWRE